MGACMSVCVCMGLFSGCFKNFRFGFHYDVIRYVYVFLKIFILFEVC